MGTAGTGPSCQFRDGWPADNADMKADCCRNTSADGRCDDDANFCNRDATSRVPAARSAPPTTRRRRPPTSRPANYPGADAWDTADTTTTAATMLDFIIHPLAASNNLIFSR